PALRVRAVPAAVGPGSAAEAGEARRHLGRLLQLRPVPVRDRQERGQRLRTVRSFRSFGWEPHPDTVLLQYWLRGEGDESGPELRSFWHWLLLRQHQKSHPADEPLGNEDLPARRLGLRGLLRHRAHAVAAVDPRRAGPRPGSEEDAPRDSWRSGTSSS